MSVTFNDFLDEQQARLKIAVGWFPGTSGISAEAIVARGFDIDEQTAAGLLNIAMQEPGLRVIQNPDTGPNAKALRLEMKDI